MILYCRTNKIHDNCLKIKFSVTHTKQTTSYLLVFILICTLRPTPISYFLWPFRDTPSRHCHRVDRGATSLLRWCKTLYQICGQSQRINRKEVKKNVICFLFYFSLELVYIYYNKKKTSFFWKCFKQILLENF